MRLFQNSSVYPAYVPRLRRLTAGARSHRDHAARMMADRYGVQHVLLPILDESPDAFLAHWNDEHGQRLWAREHGMKSDATLTDILLAQVEQHRAEVFYNLDPLTYGGSFLRMLPGCVKRRIGWRAAPSPGADFSGYDLMVCNFPSILDGYRKMGLRAAYFAPSIDPAMSEFADRSDRAIDVLFVGGYSRHHRRRAEILEAVAALPGIRVDLHLDSSRLTRLAESPWGFWLPQKHRRPELIRRVAKAPVFGRDLYAALGNAKIVLNGAIDMAGQDRGNLRCFETLGCGAALVSDSGIYPEGMVDGETIACYDSIPTALARIRSLLDNTAERERIARNGHAMLASLYSKARQWARFQELLA